MGSQLFSYHYKNSLFRVEENWGAYDYGSKNNNDITISVSLLTSIGSSSTLKKGRSLQSFGVIVPNFILDLTTDKESMLKNMNKSIQAEIKKAQKEGLIFHFTENPTDAQINEFISLYNPFARERNILEVNLDRLKVMREQQALLISYINDHQNQILCAHTILIDRHSNQAYGLYSYANYSNKTSAEKGIVGRANKYLHWKEIQLLKDKGLKWMNFGVEIFGEEGKGINEFKKKFGAIRGYDYRIYSAENFLGKIGLIGYYLKWRKLIKSYTNETNEEVSNGKKRGLMF